MVGRFVRAGDRVGIGTLDRHLAVSLARLHLVPVYRRATITLHREALVVLDQSRHVSFCLDVQLLLALLVFQADLVEVRLRTALAAAGLDPALGFVSGNV